jgi:D-psicose/D-tagatose/L-ribulose 3-epimerase
MILGLSNFACTGTPGTKLYETLQRTGLSYVETIVPRLYSNYKFTESSIQDHISILSNYKLRNYSIQSLFFQTEQTTLLDIDRSLTHFKLLLEYSKLSGTKVLVLGSPGLRKREESYLSLLTELFAELDRMFSDTDIIVVIEPNSKVYNGEYFFTVHKIVEFLAKSNYTNIRTMIDTHNCELEGNSPVEDFLQYSAYIEHIHISEVDLKPLTDLKKHYAFAEILKSYNYSKGVTYEVLPHDSLEHSIEVFKNIYKR